MTMNAMTINYKLHTTIIITTTTINNNNNNNNITWLYKLKIFLRERENYKQVYILI